MNEIVLAKGVMGMLSCDVDCVKAAILSALLSLWDIKSL